MAPPCSLSGSSIAIHPPRTVGRTNSSPLTKKAISTFEPHCQILVGINESGKSNILKALSFLAEEELPKKTDLRLEKASEARIKEAFIRFHFKIEKDDYSSIKDSVQGSVHKKKSRETTPVAMLTGNKATLDQIVLEHEYLLYEIDLNNESKYFSWYTRAKQIKILKGWKAPIENLPKEVSVSAANGETIPLGSVKIVSPDAAGDIDPSHLRDATPEDLDNLVGNAIVSLGDESCLGCIYWSYDPQNHLPPQIALDEFLANPDSCLPLKNMFQLSGIDDIRSELGAVRRLSLHHQRNLLSRVSKKTTDHVRKVWPDYKGIQIELEPHGDQILVSIVDKDLRLEFENRSDGFKRFVTFLLMVSAKVRTRELVDTLLLIDEPEVGLHPSGARHLLAELLRIAESNYVVMSTHSIFMIDKENVERHFIVRKKNEITTIERAGKSEIFDEEVLYRAIGYSIFETLKRKNVVFEGWTDKRVFQIAVEALSAKQKELKTDLEALGLCHARGVKSVRSITALLGNL